MESRQNGCFEKTKQDILSGFVSLLYSQVLQQLTSSVQRFSLLLFVPLYFLFIYFDKLFNSTNDENKEKIFFLVFGFCNNVNLQSC